MTFTTSTMYRNALTALTALTTRMRKSSDRAEEAWTGGLRRPVCALSLTQGEWLAASREFQICRHQAADMDALMDECFGEPRDRSHWVLSKKRELRRYELLDAYQLRRQPWLDYHDFAELIVAARVAEMVWRRAPQDLILLDHFLTLSEMVFDCLSPTCAEPEANHVPAVPVRFNPSGHGTLLGRSE